MPRSSQVGSKAHIPNPSLRQLEFLVGDWRTTGSHPIMPGKGLRGRTSFAWHQGGAFLIMHSQVDEPQFPDGVAIFGSDDAARTFAMIYFDERGTSRLMEVSVGERTLTWRHNNPKFAQCQTISANGAELESKGRMSRDGGPWEDDLSQSFVRIAPAEEQ